MVGCDCNMVGCDISTNPMGLTAIRLHYHADPDKNPLHPDPATAERAHRWYETARRLYPDQNDWAREMEINFFVTAGTRVFPQFTEGTHTKSLAVNRRRVIYRGWDFGWHAPAVLFVQVDSHGRLCCLKEHVATQRTTREFAEDALTIAAQYAPDYAAGYEDYCDPAGQQVKPIESERGERRDVEVLNGLGIYPKYEYGWSRKDGRALIHQLLAIRADGTPGLLVDPVGCPTLVQAFLGRYVYEDRHDGRVSEEPDDKTHPWADVMATLRYLVIGLHRLLGVRRFTAPLEQMIPTAPDFTGYGTPRRRSA